jgi:hypothetical protein
MFWDQTLRLALDWRGSERSILRRKVTSRWLRSVSRWDCAAGNFPIRLNSAALVMRSVRHLPGCARLGRPGGTPYFTATVSPAGFENVPTVTTSD